MKRPSVRLTVLGFLVITLALAMAYLLAWSLRDRSIPESEAIRLAEEFIVRNGYTDLPIDPVGRKLTPEPVVLSSSVREELQIRYDSLERKADGAYDGLGGWIVYFRYKNSRADPPSRRAVVMDSWGRHIHIMHQDAY